MQRKNTQKFINITLFSLFFFLILIYNVILVANSIIIIIFFCKQTETKKIYSKPLFISFC